MMSSDDVSDIPLLARYNSLPQKRLEKVAVRRELGSRFLH
jgi:hypothetical protein